MRRQLGMNTAVRMGRPVIGHASLQWPRALLSAALSLVLASYVVAGTNERATAPADATAACDLSGGVETTFASRIAPRVYATTDGRLVRLADIGGLNDQVATALVGQRFRMMPLSNVPDRHGIITVYAMSGAPPASPDSFLQRRLVEDAHAFVMPDTITADPAAMTSDAQNGPGSLIRRRTACLEELFRAEREAKARIGSLTRAPARLDATDAAALERLEGAFVIVTGTPRRISTSRGRIYLNFGASWRDDTTAMVTEQVAAALPGSAEAISGLAGEPIEVRGWLSLANGPLLKVSHPLAIRRADGTTAVPLDELPLEASR